jgi:hypothetical protein
MLPYSECMIRKVGLRAVAVVLVAIFYRTILNKQKYLQISVQLHNIRFHENSLYYFQSVTPPSDIQKCRQT